MRCSNSQQAGKCKVRLSVNGGRRLEQALGRSESECDVRVKCPNVNIVRQIARRMELSNQKWKWVCAVLRRSQLLSAKKDGCFALLVDSSELPCQESACRDLRHARPISS